MVTLLKLLGLEPIFKDVSQSENDDSNFVWKHIANWGYTLMIWLFLWYHPIFLLTTGIDQREVILISRSLFTFIQPVQYYIAFFYFRSQRTKRLYESTNLEFLDNPNGSWKYLPEEKQLLKLVFSIGIIFVIEAILTFGLTVQESGSYYKEYSDVVMGVGYAVIPVSLLYGRFVLTLNTHVFFFSFLQQIQKMSMLREKLEKKRWKEGKNLSVATLCYEIFDIRYTLSRMISKLEDMYSYTTILGAIGVGLLISHSDADFATITGTVIFGIMQVFFLIVIQMIGKERDRFHKIIRHRKFASTYILRRNEFCQACLEVQRESKEQELFSNMPFSLSTLGKSDPIPTGELRPLGHRRTLHKDLNTIMKITDTPGVTGSTADLQEVSLDVTRESVQDSVPNSVSIKINDIGPVEIIEEDGSSSPDPITESKESKESPDEFRKRTLGMTGSASKNDLTGYNSLESTRHRDSLEESEDIRQQIKNLLESGGIADPHVLADSGCSLTTDEFIRCIYEWVSNTGSTVDWIILNTILNEDWASFGMFGVEFSDGAALRKALSMTMALIATGSVVGFLETWSE